MTSFLLLFCALSLMFALADDGCLGKAKTLVKSLPLPLYFFLVSPDFLTHKSAQ